MKKFIFVLCMLAGTLSSFAQETFINEVVGAVKIKLDLYGPEHLNLIAPGDPRSSSGYSWNSLAYEQAVAESVQEALKKKQALYSLFNVRVGTMTLSSDIILGSNRGQELRSLTFYAESFDAENFISELTPEKLKHIRLNAVFAMKKIHSKILEAMIATLPNTQSRHLDNAILTLLNKISVYDNLYTLIDTLSIEEIAPGQILNSIEPLDINVLNAKNNFLLKTFVQNSTDDFLEFIAKICRLI